MKAREILKYAALQVPGLAAVIFVLVAARQFISYPLWVLEAAVLLWVLKDVIMFFMTRNAYVNDVVNDDNYAGLKAVAVEDLCPVGYVKVKGELWLAENAEPGSAVNSGQCVNVLCRRGTTLLVQPEN